jgi:hypothetical protein
MGKRMKRMLEKDSYSKSKDGRRKNKESVSWSTVKRATAPKRMTKPQAMVSAT